MYIGIDIGGTRIKLAAVTASGRVRSRGVLDTPGGSAAATLRRVAVASQSLLPRARYEGVGIGCAGLIQPRTGIPVSSPNLKLWEGTRLAGIARRAFGVHVHIENDATCAAWGEYATGGWKRRRSLVLITLGTGVGGGVICDGNVVRGEKGFAGELGHMTVDPDGPRCRCGNRGCVEAFAGGWAMVASVRRELKRSRGRYLSRWTQQGRTLTPQLVAEAARRGDGVARRVFRSAGDALGIAVSSLINALNPGVVVFGGGVSASFDLLEERIRKQVERRAFSGSSEGTIIARSKLGNDAAVVGAALLAKSSAAR